MKLLSNCSSERQTFSATNKKFDRIFAYKNIFFRFEEQVITAQNTSQKIHVVRLQLNIVGRASFVRAMELHIYGTLYFSVNMQTKLTDVF